MSCGDVARIVGGSVARGQAAGKRTAAQGRDCSAIAIRLASIWTDKEPETAGECVCCWLYSNAGRGALAGLEVWVSRSAVAMQSCAVQCSSRAGAPPKRPPSLLQHSGTSSRSAGVPRRGLEGVGPPPPGAPMLDKLDRSVILHVLSLVRQTEQVLSCML